MTNVDMFDEIKKDETIKKLKKQLREAQGELSIIKGIGNNSPEMRRLQKRVKELEEIEKAHQELNGELHDELELEKKNHTITREDVQLKDLEIGRMMKKLTRKDS
jgi:G3E family GTPase